jgi:hypothetical protein
VILDDRTAGRFIHASYAHCSAIGLLVHVLAETGARPSQAARHWSRTFTRREPAIIDAEERQGREQESRCAQARARHVPISEALAARLKAAAKGRRPDAPLLLQSDGQPWSKNPSNDYREDIR